MEYWTNENELIRLAQNDDSNAINLIINEYRKIVRAKSRTFYLAGGDQEDLIQEGMIGLLNAVRDFDINKNIKFATFANLCITRQMLTAIKTANRDKNNILNNAYSLNKLLPSSTDEEFELLDIIEDSSIFTPEDIYISNEGVENIFNIIETNLSKFEKAVLTLFLDGETYITIAEHFEKDTKSIDNALQRIRKKLDKVIN